MQQEQIRLQKINNILQIGNIMATIENTAAVNRMKDAVDYNTAVNQQGFDNVNQQLGGINQGIYDANETLDNINDKLRKKL